MSARLRSSEIRHALAPGSDPEAATGAGAERTYAGVATDSRSVGPGELFVALPGERVDGADFLEDAAARGAAGAIVASGRQQASLDLEFFPVDDPRAALGELARFVRRRAGVRVVGITGSSGKTTVKEMVALALAGGHRVFRTEGNLNSQIGLPLSILGAPDDADVWVLEMGASEPGEIRRLAEIAEPDDALVTTVGAAHLEAFGDERAVLAEKLSLVEGARPTGAAVVGELPPELPRAARLIREDVVVAGLGEAADYRPERSEVEPERVWFEKHGVRYEVPAGGEHHLRDALLAAALADRLGVDPGAAAAGLAGYRPVGMRGALLRLNGMTVVADCYNANPESFLAAIAYCRDLYPDRRRVAFIGSMLELGAREAAAHRDVAAALAGAGFVRVAATGAFAPAARELSASPASPSPATEWIIADDPAEAWPAFAAGLEGDEVVLVKASRGARLEAIVERLQASFDAGEAA